MSLTIEGEVESPRTFTLAELTKLPQQIEDIGGLMAGKKGGAVWLDAVLKAAKTRPAAKFATLVAEDGKFAVCVPLDAVRTNAVIAFRFGKDPLPDSLGGPMRFFVVDAKACGADSGVDACANVKRLGRIRLTVAREPDVGHEHK